MIINYLRSIIMRLFAPSFKTQFNKTLDNLSLSNFEKDIICRRYLDIVAKMESDYMRVCILYVTLTSIVALSSVLVTMVSPFEKIVGMPPVLGTIIFWGGWGLSFILTVANKWLLFGNYGKKYVLNWVLLEKYRNEGWSFASGINKYKNCVDMSAKFRLFCARVERIKMKSMEIMPEIETNEVNEILSTGS